VFYGASGCGKTFLSLDLAAHVALGWNWRERKLNQGTVIYIAAEGGLGIEERLTGFRLHYKIDVTDVPLHIIAEPMDLCRSAEDAALLTERCDTLSPISLIVVDTLSRVMAGGNENAPDDMGRFVANCDRLRLSTGAHVLVIHHSGKDDGRGARGHSLLKAAADTEIAVEKNEISGVVTATVAKQRDHRMGDPFAFRLIPVEIGTDENGEPVTSCVVEPERGAVVRTEAKRQRDPKAAQIALRALAEAVDEQGAVPPSSIHIPTSIKVVSVSVWRRQAYLRGISL
jgi:AAA domain-containing protein